MIIDNQKSDVLEVVGEQTARTATINTNKIKKLQYENNIHSLSYDKLNDKQIAIVEKVYQDMIKVHNIKPISFGGGADVITAKKMIESIFSLLTNGRRVVAIKEIRSVTGMGLIPSKNLVDDLIKSIIQNKNLEQEVK